MVESSHPSSPLRRFCDLATIGLLTGGETLSGLLGPAWQVGSFGVLFLAGVIFFLLRHLFWPQPPLPAIIWRWLVGPAGHDTGAILALTVAIRAAVLLAGLAAVLAWGYELQPGQPRFARNELLNLPARFDAGWYVGIARSGYEWRDDLRGRQQPIAFFPAYPVATRVAGDLLTVPAKLFRAPGFLENGYTRVLWGGMLVSFVCLIAAACRIAGLARHEMADQRRTRWTVALVMLWPFALFFSGAYTEAMFLMGLAGLLLAWHERRFAHGALWGVLCGLTRPNGWTVSLALLVDIVLSKTSRDRRGVRVMTAASPLLGNALYSAYVFSVAGHPFEWARAHGAWGVSLHPFSFLARRAEAIDRLGVAGYLRTDAPDAAMIACVVLAMWATTWFLMRRRWMYAALIGGYLVPALITDTPSIGRMTAVLFPVALMLVQATPPRVWPVLGAMFGTAQLFLAARHFRWLSPY